MNRNNSIGSWHGKASLLFSAIAILVSIVAITSQWRTSMIAADRQAWPANASGCLAWADYVRQEQADLRWEDTPKSEVDARIDRLGAVAMARAVNRFEHNGGSASDFDRELNMNVVRPISIAQYCGSAAEYRLARTSSSEERLILPNNP